MARYRLEGRKGNKIVVKALIWVAILLYLLFLYMDISPYIGLAHRPMEISSDVVKYITIIICFTISLFIGGEGINRRDYLLLTLGLFFTLIADLFLLLLSYDTLGVALFCIAQILYSIRYNRTNTKPLIKRELGILGVLLAAHFILKVYTADVDFLYTISLFYAVLLIGNVVSAIRAYKKDLFPIPNGAMIALGMILFLLCDINVALYNIMDNSTIPFLFIWFFYLPSQIMLALSGGKWEKTDQNISI